MTFDIDANGIVAVGAMDKGTGKEQKITIQASGGLSDDDIEKMVKDAEENAEADKERRELVEAKNQAESLIHSTEKSMEEHADKVDPTTVEAIELAIAALKDDLETENADKIKSGIQNVTESAMKLGEAIYKARRDEAMTKPTAADRDPDDRHRRCRLRRPATTKSAGKARCGNFPKGPVCKQCRPNAFPQRGIVMSKRDYYDV